jgi:hypothetical protein
LPESQSFDFQYLNAKSGILCSGICWSGCRLVLISVAYLTGIVTGHTLPLSCSTVVFPLLAVFFFLSLLIPHKACSICGSVYYVISWAE